MLEVRFILLCLPTNGGYVHTLTSALGLAENYYLLDERDLGVVSIQN